MKLQARETATCNKRSKHRIVIIGNRHLPRLHEVDACIVPICSFSVSSAWVGASRVHGNIIQLDVISRSSHHVQDALLRSSYQSYTKAVVWFHTDFTPGSNASLVGVIYAAVLKRSSSWDGPKSHLCTWLVIANFASNNLFDQFCQDVNLRSTGASRRKGVKRMSLISRSGGFAI